MGAGHSHPALQMLFQDFLIIAEGGSPGFMLQESRDCPRRGYHFKYLNSTVPNSAWQKLAQAAAFGVRGEITSSFTGTLVCTISSGFTGTAFFFGAPVEPDSSAPAGTLASATVMACPGFADTASLATPPPAAT